MCHFSDMKQQRASVKEEAHMCQFVTFTSLSSWLLDDSLNVSHAASRAETPMCEFVRFAPLTLLLTHVSRQRLESRTLSLVTF